MKLSQVMAQIETWAPPQLQESYDNSGLLVGNPDMRVLGIMTTLDCTEAVVEEALEKGCNLIVAHHPVIFSGLKKLTPDDYVGRTVMLAIRHNIALYAAHTNLDVIQSGVNKRLAEVLGLQNPQILRPRSSELRKLVCYIPDIKLSNGEMAVEKVRQALFEAGAGNISNYDQCSFGMPGTGTFRPQDNANPYLGQTGVREEAQEYRVEVIYPRYKEAPILRAMEEAHPYEEVAHDILPLTNAHPQIGAGMIGEWSKPMVETDFLAQIKEKLQAQGLRHSPCREKVVHRVAICGGAGFFLLKDALGAQADAFVTSDLKYHQFFDADGKILLVDPGHYETEQYTVDLLFDKLTALFPNFAILKCSQNTNPVNHF